MQTEEQKLETKELLERLMVEYETQAELARALGMAQSQLSVYLSGKTPMGNKLKTRLWALLGHDRVYMCQQLGVETPSLYSLMQKFEEYKKIITYAHDAYQRHAENEISKLKQETKLLQSQLQVLHDFLKPHMPD